MSSTSESPEPAFEPEPIPKIGRSPALASLPVDPTGAPRRAVCVFCGSRLGHEPRYRELAEHVGCAIAQRGLNLIYGGGRVGLMGVVADAALEAGGPVVGVIPRFMDRVEIAHHGLTDLQIVPDMHRRKALLVQQADAVLTLPGGIGTFEEFFEVLSWIQLGLYDHPLGLLNRDGFFDPLLELIDHGERAGFIRPQTGSRLIVEDQPEPILDRLLAAMPALEPTAPEP